jgi:hypothetical protein
VANAVRVASSKAVLGQPHAAIYQQIGAVPATYAAAFKDVSSGSNGTCTTCTAKAGYDTPTGWGTPNVASLLTGLGTATSSTTTTTTTTTTAPKLTTTSLAGVAGKALSASIAYSAPSSTSLTISISGAPSGMSFSASSGAIAVTWAKPVTGSYTLSITLKDNLGQTSTGTVAVKITAS